MCKKTENAVFERSTGKMNHTARIQARRSTLKMNQHHYIERDTGQVCSERPIGDWDCELSL
jgi:hypothetical protein